MSKSAARTASQDVTKEQMLQKAQQTKPTTSSQNYIERVVLQAERFMIKIDGLCWPMDEVRRVLAPRDNYKPRVLDIGSTIGEWVSDMAKEFPHADVLGIDKAPVRPSDAPSNCSVQAVDFANLNIDQLGKFDVIHAGRPGNFVRPAIPFLSRAVDMLKPGGLLLISDSDNTIYDQNRNILAPAFQKSDSGKASWWARFWKEVSDRLPQDTYVFCHKTENFEEWMKGEQRLEDVKLRRQFIPLGRFDQGEMDLCKMEGSSEMPIDIMMGLVEGIRPRLLLQGLPEDELDMILREAQADLVRLKTYAGWLSFVARRKED